MKIQPIQIKWEVEVEDEDERKEEESNGVINCPQCGKTWMEISNGEAYIQPDPDCLHLKFAIEPGVSSASEVGYFNGFTEEKFLAAVSEAYRQYDRESDGMTAEEIFSDALVDEEFWKKAVLNEVNILFDFTQEGICCGPVSQTAYFGAQLAL